MAELNEQIPVEEITNTESYVQYKVKELLSFIKDNLSKKDNYEGKSELFKQNLQHELFQYIETYEQEIKKIADAYEESSNSNTYLREVQKLDDETRILVDQKIIQTLRKDYVPPSREVIEQRQREWLKATENRAREYYRTPEGRKYKEEEQARQRVSYQNRKDPLIKKMRQGENFTEEMSKLNEQIAKLDPEVRSKIELIERRYIERSDAQIQKITEEFDLKKENIKRMFTERTRQYPRNEEQYEARINQLNEDEDNKKRQVRVKTENYIVFMKTDYLRTGVLPKVPEVVVEEEVEAQLEEKPKPNPKIEPELNDPNLYTLSIIHHKISVPFINIGSNMEYYFKKHAIRFIEGKCRKEGYIRPNSIKVCFPREEMIIRCKIVNITKIGIRAIVSEIHNPIVLFISREHNANKNFDDYEEGNIINIKVIGHRFELNDEYIGVIGEII